MQKLKFNKMTHVFQEKNGVVDSLAKKGTKEAVFDEQKTLLVTLVYAKNKWKYIFFEQCTLD